MAKKRVKYNLYDVGEEKELLSDTSMKAIIEFLLVELVSLSDEEHWNFAESIYGENIRNKGFSLASIKSVNEIVIEDRFKKLVNKEMEFGESVFMITIVKTA